MTKARILIVDDQLEVRAEVKERIVSLGHETDEAACQEDARRKIDGMQYDCVLLDLKIPVKLEGVARIEYGKNLLERIVAMPGAPPVIVITSHGLEGHTLAVEMMEIGAKSFVGKPFAGGLLELKIQQILGKSKDRAPQKSSRHQPFNGGVLVMNDDGIELCEILIAGKRADAVIRGVIEQLAKKRGEKYVRASAKTLANAISETQNPGSLIAAIKDFRDQCSHKLGEKGIECANDDVIQTTAGGYQLRESIQVKLGKDELLDQAEDDCAQVLRAFGRKKKLTIEEIRQSVTLSAVCVKAAVAALELKGKIRSDGGSGSKKAYHVVTA